MGASYYCVGGAEGWEERNKEAKKAGWGRPDQADRAGRGGGGRVAETEREIKTERLIGRQTEKEGDREILLFIVKDILSKFVWLIRFRFLLRQKGAGGRAWGPQCETKTVYYIKNGGRGVNCYIT